MVELQDFQKRRRIFQSAYNNRANPKPPAKQPYKGEALSPFLPGNNKAPRCYRKKDRNYVEKTYTLQELVNMNLCVCLISISLFLFMLLFP
jgi:hypothetical protein